MKKLMVLLGVLAGTTAYEFIKEKGIIKYKTLILKNMFGWECEDGFFTKGNMSFAIEENDGNVLKMGAVAEGEHYNNDFSGILVKKDNSFAYYLFDNVNWKGYLLAFSRMNFNEVAKIIKNIQYTR